MAASCMLIESIGEGVKAIDKAMSGFFITYAPDTDWKSLKGMRDHIAHGYFKIDADTVFETSKNEIPQLQATLEKLVLILKDLLYEDFEEN